MYPKVDRFSFQRQCVEKVNGKTLNVGCSEDPAHIKSNYPNVTNLDMYPYEVGKFIFQGIKVPIPVDIVHNILRFPWPLEDKSFDLVILGDILEDLPDNEQQLDVLKEAKRIANNLCITTPQDTKERDWHHYTTITEQRLKKWLEKAGWQIEEWQTIDYGFVPEGYLVFAKAS